MTEGFTGPSPTRRPSPVRRTTPPARTPATETPAPRENGNGAPNGEEIRDINGSTDNHQGVNGNGGADLEAMLYRSNVETAQYARVVPDNGSDPAPTVAAPVVERPVPHIPLLPVAPPPPPNGLGTNGRGAPPPPPHREANAVPVVPPPRRPLRPLVAVVILGLILGGLLGGTLGSLRTKDATATALVQLATTPDPALAAASGSLQSEDTVAGFISAEIAWLAGDNLNRAVATRLGNDPTAEPVLTVTQVGQSSVVTFSAHATSDDKALQLVTTAVEIYVDRRRTSLRTNAKNSLDSVDRTLKDLNLPPPDPNAKEVDPRLSRLLALRSDLLLLTNSDDAGVQILEPPVSSRPGSPSWLIMGVMGAAAGALAGLGGLALYRSRRTTVEGRAAASAVVDRVLHPEVGLPGTGSNQVLLMSRQRDQDTAALLVTQIARRRTMAGHVIAVVGASPGSGSREIATMIAVGLAPQVPTVLAEFGRKSNPHPLLPAQTGSPKFRWQRSLAPMAHGLEIAAFDELPHVEKDSGWRRLMNAARTGGRCVVLDLGNSTEIMRLLPSVAESILVLGAGVDSVATSTALATGARIGEEPLLGVVTRQPLTARMPWSRRDQAVGV